MPINHTYNQTTSTAINLQRLGARTDVMPINYTYQYYFGGILPTFASDPCVYNLYMYQWEEITNRVWHPNLIGDDDY